MDAIIGAYWRSGQCLYELVDADNDTVIVRNVVDESEHILEIHDFTASFKIVWPLKEAA